MSVAVPACLSLCYYQCRCSVVDFSYQYNMSVRLWDPAAPISSEKTVLRRSREGSPETRGLSSHEENLPVSLDIPVTANMLSKIPSGLQRSMLENLE